MSSVDLNEAAAVIEAAAGVVQRGVDALKAAGPDAVDTHQVLAYDVAHAASAVETARGMLDYGAKGDTEAAITAAFVADAVADLGA
ncbi:MAG: acyl-CoA dehydrogenase, partial [Acidimicrobiia bacterium]|nr:acyl-CoA dehydrogenase [Acidimicrobiia bacterium]